MKKMHRLGWLTAVALLLGTGGALAQYQVDSRLSYCPLTAGGYDGSLLIVGTNFYGMNTDGGGAGVGTVASDLAVLHTFTNSPGDGANPHYNSLAIAGSTLYGMTAYGGTNTYGTLFKVGTTGTGYGIMHYFRGPPGDGSTPYSTPVINGATLYGTTTGGGSNNFGTIFSVNTNGLGYTLRHQFGTFNDGSFPYGSLVQCGTALYGTTMGGGTNGRGTFYKMNLDGTGYAVWYHCAAASGTAPLGELTQVGGNFYGLMNAGGVSNQGVIFRIGTNGNNYAVLHYFTGTATDGAAPYRSLTSVGSILYGATYSGGASNLGTIFCICTNGTAFTVLHSFAGGSDGAYCLGNLSLLGTKLYGRTLGSIFGWGITGPKLFFQEPAGTVAGWLLDSSGRFQLAFGLGNTGAWKLKAAGDIDGDGVSDLVFQTPEGRTAIWFMNADGSQRSAREIDSARGWEVRACADYLGFGPGHAQLFFQSGGTMAYWQLDATGARVSSSTNFALGAWQLRGAGNLDGDHKAELFFMNGGQLAIWFHNPDGTIRGTTASTGLGTWQVRGVVDIDSDGVSDLAWQNTDGNLAGWWMNASGTSRAPITTWGTVGAWVLKGAGR